MPKERILVAGATGTQGGAVVNALLAGGIPVQALVRDPSSAAARALAGRGVELIKGDFEDAGSLQAAMQGVRGVFSMQLPPVADETSELRTGRQLVEAARAAGVETFVHTSVARAGDEESFVGWDEGRWWKPYWTSKSGVNEMVRTAGFPRWVILKPAIIMDNFLLPKAAFMYPLLESSGKIVTAIARDTKIDLIDVDDIGAFAAAAFADPARFDRQEIDLAVEALTLSEIADEITRVTGKPITIEHITAQESRSRGTWDLVVSSEEWHNVEGYRVDHARARSHGIRLKTFAEFAQLHASKFVIGSR